MSTEQMIRWICEDTVSLKWLNNLFGSPGLSFITDVIFVVFFLPLFSVVHHFESSSIAARKFISSHFFIIGIKSQMVKAYTIGNRGHLRSAARGDLAVPRSRTTRYGQRCFAVSSPTLWNSLPLSVGDLSLTLTQFCARLKTVLFCRTYETLA